MSWRPWDIKLDDQVVGRIGGAGSKVISAEPGRHDLSIKYGGGESQKLSINVTDDRATMVLIGMGIGGAGRVGAKVCDKVDDLPKGAIPIHAPGGNTQTFAQGRSKAVAGLAVAIGIDLLLWVLGALAVVKGISGNDAFRVVIGVGVFAIAAWLAIKLRPGARLVTHQWSWPLEDWRVDSKGAEQEEWKRWAS